MFILSSNLTIYDEGIGKSAITRNTEHSQSSQLYRYGIEVICDWIMKYSIPIKGGSFKFTIYTKKDDDVETYITNPLVKKFSEIKFEIKEIKDKKQFFNRSKDRYCCVMLGKNSLWAKVGHGFDLFKDDNAEIQKKDKKAYNDPDAFDAVISDIEAKLKPRCDSTHIIEDPIIVSEYT